MKYWIKRLFYLIKSGSLFKVLPSYFNVSKKKMHEKIIPVKTLHEITGKVDFITVNNEFQDGNISPYELECICSIVKYAQPKRIFEIGTFNGKTSLNMAANSSPDSHVYTLDLPKSEITKTKLRIKSGERAFIDKEQSGTQFIGTPYEKMITQIYSDSAKYDYSILANTIDLVFIDGSHAYEYVVNDTEAALKLLRNGKGIILWHDYGWAEVIKALNEYYKNDTRFKNMINIKDTSIVILQIN
jgi:predicted O-methyltransferase YrrM